MILKKNINFKIRYLTENIIEKNPKTSTGIALGAGGSLGYGASKLFKEPEPVVTKLKTIDTSIEDVPNPENTMDEILNKTNPNIDHEKALHNLSNLQQSHYGIDSNFGINQNDSVLDKISSLAGQAVDTIKNSEVGGYFTKTLPDYYEKEGILGGIGKGLEAGKELLTGFFHN